MGRYDVGSTRNVWLPGAGVWACLPQSSDAVEGDPSPPSSVKGDDRELPETHSRKRGRGSSPSASCSRKDVALGLENSSGKQGSLTRVAAQAEAEADGLGSGVRVERGDAQCASSSHDVMCPICLGNIEDSAGEAVLQWCMHRFCTHCIEEWSKVRRACPLCKAEYRGWYYGVQSNNEFQERILPPIAGSSARHNSRGDTSAFSRFHLWRGSRRQERGRGRWSLQPSAQGQGVAPDASASSSGRSGPFPTQRSFGLPRQHQGAQAMRILEEQAAAKALQWRKSIYNRNLKARPFEIGKRSMGTKFQDAKARAERRLEPWVRRELQAVLPNSDHAFLVRLVLGLWFGVEHEANSIHIAERHGRSSGQHTSITRNAAGSTEVEVAGEMKAIKELKLFIGEKAALFWRELRCFAESPFTMQAYDTVVVYTRHPNSRRSTNRADGRSSHQDTLDSRRRPESTAPRFTSRHLISEEPGHLENNHQILGARRHSVSHSCAAQGVQSSFGQHQKDNARDARADHRKRRLHIDVTPIAEDRWQLSYC